jgi:hypothetical protein
MRYWYLFIGICFSLSCKKKANPDDFTLPVIPLDTVSAIFVSPYRESGYDTTGNNYINQINLYGKSGEQDYYSWPDSSGRQYSILYVASSNIVIPSSSISRQGDTIVFPINANLRGKPLLDIYSYSDLDRVVIPSDSCKIYFNYIKDYAISPDTVSSVQLGYSLDYFFKNNIAPAYRFYQ